MTIEVFQFFRGDNYQLICCNTRNVVVHLNMKGVYSLLKKANFNQVEQKGTIAQINIFCIDEDNFIKSVTENWLLQKRLWPALASLRPLLSSDFFSARNLFLWKTKKISSSRGERISLAEEMDFFCERAPSSPFLACTCSLPRLAPPSKSQPH